MIERLFAPDALVRFTRVSGTTEPWRGAKAIREVAERPSEAKSEFTILHTVAEGPIVVHRRIDRFTDLSGAHCASHGLQDMAICEDQYIAVFVMKDGQIQEWWELEVAQSKPVEAFVTMRGVAVAHTSRAGTHASVPELVRGHCQVEA